MRDRHSVRFLSYVFACIGLLTVSFSVIGADHAATLVLKGVTVIDHSGASADRVVNIVIRDGVVELATEDPVDEGEIVAVFDASETVIIGEFTTGQRAQFLLLDEAPALNPEILLDTATHASFAIVNGIVLRNRFKRDYSRQAPPSGWFAYSPPPIALPSAAEMGESWNHYKGDNTAAIFTGAIGLDRTRYTQQNRDSELQVGKLESFEGGEVRGFRFGVVGRLNFERPWLYTVFGATNEFDRGFELEDDDSFTWYDYRLDIPVFSEQTLSIGKQKEPINLERGMSMFALPFQERTIAADYFFRSRNLGAILSGNGLDKHLSWAGGVFNDWLEAGGSRSDNATIFSSRITYAPLATQNSNLLHLGFGFRHSNGSEGFQRTATPEIHSAPAFIDSGDRLQAEGSDTFNYELSWRAGPVWLDGEFTHVKVDDSPMGDLSFSGYHFAASWIVTGEMRPYNYRNGTFNALPVSHPVNRGGWGAWEVGVRYSNIDASDKNVVAGESSVFTLAINWWLRADTNVSLNWQHVTLDRPLTTFTPSLRGEVEGIVARLTLILD